MKICSLQKHTTWTLHGMSFHVGREASILLKDISTLSSLGNVCKPPQNYLSEREDTETPKHTSRDHVSIKNIIAYTYL